MAHTAGLQDLTDESLMVRVQNADHGAFAVLVRRHTRLFFSAAYRMCSNADDAEDIVQDAFMKLWNNPQGWDSGRGAKFTTWFYRVVTNQAIDFVRRKKNTKGSDDLERIVDKSEGQSEALERKEQDAVLERAIQALPERQRAALNLCFYEGLSNREAADILGVGVKALESLLMRAKAGLKEELERCGILEEETGNNKRGGQKYG